MDKIAIFGASGFGREVLDICLELGACQICFLEVDPKASEYIGFKLLRDAPEQVLALAADGWSYAIGIGTPAIRRRIFETYSDLPFPTLIHPTATFGYRQRDEFELSRGSVVAAGVRVTNNVKIGDQVVLNLNCTVGHDSVISDCCAVMPGVNISGNVHMERQVYIGTGAAVINGSNERFLRVSEGAIIGAGAVVVRDVDAWSTVVGAPAKPINRS